MKLLYIVHQFFPRHYTGTERLTLDLATQMQRMGHEPTIVTYETADDPARFSKLTDTVLIKNYTYQGVPVISLKHKLRADPIQIFNSAIEEAAKTLSLKCDLVHIFHPMWLSSLARMCKNSTVPVVLTLTDAWLLCPSALLDRGFGLCNGPTADGGCKDCNVGAKMESRLEDARFVFEMADEVAAASKFLPTIFQRNGWNRKVDLVPHSVNFQHVRRIEWPPSRNVTFGFMGTLAWHKGAHVLVKASRMAKDLDFQVKIYGSTVEQWDYFKMLVDLTEGDERIKFLDSFEYEKLPEIMRDLSVLVIPSTYYENYPLVMLLALAYKVPVISSNIGGMPEVIRDGFNGFLFEIGDYAQLSGIMERIVKEPQIIDNLRKNIATPRRIEEEALEYENIYMKLMK